jgi:hypothetical protein
MTRFRFTSLTAALLLAATAAHAATFVLDGDSGADYDAVGDGWFFADPQTVPPPDGVGDLGGNDLAVAYQAGVVELRAMAEFPLAALGGLAAGDIQSATLTVTIDDVLGTFGPGTTFDSTAADPIVVFAYPADGTVAVSDFSPAGLVEVGQLASGGITDVTLAGAGAVAFDVDVTAELQDALTNGDAAFGALLATLDSPTGTSFDATSPPGVAGGALPYLTVVTGPAAPPVLGSAELACQRQLGKQATKLAAIGQKALAGCLDAVLKDAAMNDGLVGPAAESKCAKLLDPADPTAKLTKALGKFDGKVLAKCGELAPAAIGSPCAGGAATIEDTVACARDAAQDAAESLVGTLYASGCTLLAAVGLDTDYPGVCTP